VAEGHLRRKREAPLTVERAVAAGFAGRGIVPDEQLPTKTQRLSLPRKSSNFALREQPGHADTVKSGTAQLRLRRYVAAVNLVTSPKRNNCIKLNVTASSNAGIASNRPFIVVCCEAATELTSRGFSEICSRKSAGG
jgi:hypothetical protein